METSKEINPLNVILEPKNYSLLLVCRVQGLDAGDEAAAWLSEVLKRDCRLIQMSPKHLREAKGHKG